MDMARYHIPQPHCGAATASTNHTVAAPLPLLPLLVVPLLPLLPLLFVRSLPLLPVTSKRMVSAPYATRSSPEPSGTRPAARSGRRCSQGIHWDGRPVDRRECLEMAAHPAHSEALLCDDPPTTAHAAGAASGRDGVRWPQPSPLALTETRSLHRRRPGTHGQLKTACAAAPARLRHH